MSKPTPKADALRAMRESEAANSDNFRQIATNDDATLRVEALLIRAQYRLNRMADPCNPSPDEVLIHDLSRMLAAAFGEEEDGGSDDALPLFGVREGEVMTP